MSFDFSLFQFIHSLAGQSKFLDWLGLFFGDYSAYVLVLAALYFLIKERNWQKRFYYFGLTSLSVILARGIITEIIRFILVRPRPFSALNFMPLIGGENPLDSFPSGHATAFFALGFAIFYFCRKAEKKYFKNPGTWFIVAATLMGVARIFAGIHWPLDIIGGALIGWASAYLVFKLLPRPETQ